MFLTLFTSKFEFDLLRCVTVLLCTWLCASVKEATVVQLEIVKEQSKTGMKFAMAQHKKTVVSFSVQPILIVLPYTGQASKYHVGYVLELLIYRVFFHDNPDCWLKHVIKSSNSWRLTLDGFGKNPLASTNARTAYSQRMHVHIPHPHRVLAVMTVDVDGPLNEHSHTHTHKRTYCVTSFHFNTSLFYCCNFNSLCTFSIRFVLVSDRFACKYYECFPEMAEQHVNKKQSSLSQLTVSQINLWTVCSYN